MDRVGHKSGASRSECTQNSSGSRKDDKSNGEPVLHQETSESEFGGSVSGSEAEESETIDDSENDSTYQNDSNEGEDSDEDGTPHKPERRQRKLVKEGHKYGASRSEYTQNSSGSRKDDKSNGEPVLHPKNGESEFGGSVSGSEA